MSKTLEIYNLHAPRLAAQYEGFTPTRSYELAHAFFQKGEPTIDIGSGSGRDVSYLSAHGFPATGVDGSNSMLTEARRYHGEHTFAQDSLPDLATLRDVAFVDLFCNAVLMHLTEADLVKGLLNILRVLAPKGRAVISFREASDPQRDIGRHITSLTPNQVAELFESLGGKVLLVESLPHEEVSWHYIVVEKTEIELKDGLSRIQDIITNDTKTATYKLALLRALCDLARNESHTAFWDPKLDFVVVPLERLALSWLRYYWEPIRLGIRQTTKGELAFTKNVRELFDHYSNPRDVILEFDSGKPGKIALAAVRKIAETIDKGPVQYAGGGATPVFGRRSKVVFGADDPARWKSVWYQHDGIKVPAAMWRDIRLFHHWIEKSLVMEWVELTARTIDSRRRTSTLFEVFSNADFADKRDTSDIRKLLQGQKLRCVWTKKPLREFHVDHVIPYSVWRNNDFWNLLPACAKVNTTKNLYLPHPDTIRANSELILEYWDLYWRHFKERFEQQAVRALGMTQEKFSLEDTLGQLTLVSAQLHSSRGIRYFS